MSAQVVYNGTSVLSKIKQGAAYKAVAASLSSSLELTYKMLNTTSKDSGAGEEQIPDRYSWKSSGSANVNDDSAVGATGVSAKVFSDAFLNKTIIDFTFSSSDSKIFYGGLGYLSSFKITADDGKIVTFDYTIEGTGTLVDVAP